MPHAQVLRVAISFLLVLVSKLHVPIFILQLTRVGLSPELGQNVFEVARDASGRVYLLLQERLDEDLDAFFFSEEVETGLKGRNGGCHHHHFDALVFDLVFQRIVAAAGVGEELAVEILFVVLDVVSVVFVVFDFPPAETAIFLPDLDEILVVLGLPMTDHHKLCVHICSRNYIKFNKISFMLYLPGLLLPARTHHRHLFPLLQTILQPHEVVLHALLVLRNLQSA